MTINGGDVDVLAVIHTGSTISTVLGASAFHLPASMQSRGFIVVLVVAIVASAVSVATTTEVVVQKSMTLEGGSAVGT